MVDIEHWKEQAKKYYEDLPYHNFKHALDVLARAEKLMQGCQKYAVPVNEDVVRLAALFHDAGYADDVEGLKEAHAAKIAQKELFGKISDDEFMMVAQAILATHVKAPLKTVEDKILRAADLHSLAADYGTFEKNNELLRHEQELLSGKHLSDDEWKEQVQYVLESYLVEEIHISPEFAEDNFYNKARANLDIFLKS